ncbi:alpha/beta hydrolase [Chitinophaga filiformis]|uniref:alpha/beta fold hydrolase n=1 Tax=Chitinophaga filiformis TaxID=104663 RepID=UPI001F16B660|nr:alpha/beta hydrolase [Chitinophaga filiformis]MCF6405049.1 alpha/beta hydrolase [Chitinophaga filiformis]
MKTIHLARTILTTLFILNTFVMEATAQQAKATNPATLKSSGYAPVNGLKLYYEIHGEGQPLVLLHGAYMTIDLNWSQLLPELAKTHKVIALEMQGHGRTADIDRPVSRQALADDVAGLLQYLKIDSADILGYSMGGTVAYAFAIQHPAMVKKLILVSTVYKFHGWQKEVTDIFQTFKPEFFDQTPLKAAYEKVAPDPGHWRAFLTKYMEYGKQDFDFGADKVKAIKSPILFIMGDNDGVTLEHKAEMYRAAGGGVPGDMAGLPKSQLAIFPGTTHVSLMADTSRLLSVINPFLDK